jgi:hypothetical protein
VSGTQAIRPLCAGGDTIPAMTREIESARHDSAHPGPREAGAHDHPASLGEHLSSVDTDEVVIGLIVVVLCIIGAMLIMLR